MVVHLVNEDIYLSLTFTAWGRFHSGGFAYTRSTPAVVAPPPTPTISITSPSNGSVFAAPAAVKLAANASVSTGTVTNVAFFGNTTKLGSVTASPFNFTTGNLSAGSYALTAVATAAGVSATSSVVNISVVTPLPVTNTTPKITNGSFTFKYSANLGLKYVVESSSNLVNWVPVVTNAATLNPVPFSDTLVTNGSHYYRVGRLPNP
ncbi:MAG: hypothetical protein JWQ04_2248 [Pedosphaera sp.]|nr:hypothetical protein [Pedosphaera sp.]